MLKKLIILSCCVMVGSLGTAQPSKAGGDSPRGFKTGKYNCFVYMNSLPVLAEALTFNPGGTYATRGGGAKTGRYSFDSKLADSKSAKINLSGGPMDGAVIALEAKGAIRVLPQASRGSTNPKWASMYCSPALK